MDDHRPRTPPAQNSPPGTNLFHVEQAAVGPAAASGAGGGARRRPAPLSYDEVAKAADAVEQAGEKVTIARIRLQVGGATETITRFINHWREARRAGAQAISRDGVPEGLRVALMQAFAAHRQAAQQEIHQRLEEQSESTQELDKALAAARDTIKDQASESDALRESMAKTRQEAEAFHQAAQLQHKKLEGESAVLTRQNSELRQELDAMRMDMTEVRINGERAVIRAEGLKDENQRLRDETRRLGDEAREAERALALANQSAAVATAQLQGTQKRLDDAREQLKANQTHASELSQEARRTHERASVAEEEKQALRHKLDAAHHHAVDAAAPRLRPPPATHAQAPSTENGPPHAQAGRHAPSPSYEKKK